MKTFIKFLTCISLTSLFWSCEKDFIVKDIKNKTVSIISPNDNISTPYNTITFWWDELDGAERYNLQIVQPGFNNIQQLLVDTNVTGNKFNHTFNPGTYQWRIKAINAGGSTVYTTRTFIIDSTSNMGYVSVSLVAPNAYSVTTNNYVMFSWNSLPFASSYELKVTAATGSVTTISNISGTSYPLTFSVAAGAEDIFSWQVKAFNSQNQTSTLTNTTRLFKIDKKGPTQPSNLNPNTYGTQHRDTTKLTWTRSNDHDIKHDLVLMSDDSLYSNLLINTTVSGTPSLEIRSVHTYTGSAKEVWWKVISVDSVGNQSNPASSKRIYLY